MKKHYLIIIAVVILISISIICSSLMENNRSIVVFSQNCDYKININTATVEELSFLPEIGIEKAKLIVEYREKHRFVQISDITNVRGIGKAIYKQIESLITV